MHLCYFSQRCIFAPGRRQYKSQFCEPFTARIDINSWRNFRYVLRTRYSAMRIDMPAGERGFISYRMAKPYIEFAVRQIYRFCEAKISTNPCLASSPNYERTSISASFRASIASREIYALSMILRLNWCVDPSAPLRSAQDDARLGDCAYSNCSINFLTNICDYL